MHSVVLRKPQNALRHQPRTRTLMGSH